MGKAKTFTESLDKPKIDEKGKKHTAADLINLLKKVTRNKVAIKKK